MSSFFNSLDLGQQLLDLEQINPTEFHVYKSYGDWAASITVKSEELANLNLRASGKTMTEAVQNLYASVRKYQSTGVEALTPALLMAPAAE